MTWGWNRKRHIFLLKQQLTPLIERLQALRDALGRPVIINSGYRNREHNQVVGGSLDSYHLRGMAVDIRMPGLNPAALAAAAH